MNYNSQPGEIPRNTTKVTGRAITGNMPKDKARYLVARGSRRQIQGKREIETFVVGQ